MGITDDDLDGHTLRKRYADETFILLPIRWTSDTAYSSGCRYALHYVAASLDTVDMPTLNDGTDPMDTEFIDFARENLNYIQTKVIEGQLFGFILRIIEDRDLAYLDCSVSAE